MLISFKIHRAAYQHTLTEIEKFPVSQHRILVKELTGEFIADDIHHTTDGCAV